MIHRSFESVRTRANRIAQLGLAIAIASLGGLASAQSAPGTDVVRTHDGTTTRGTILEYPADGGVMMRTDAGDVRVFAEADIAFIGTGETAAPPTAEVPQPAAAAPEPAVDAARPVLVIVGNGDPRHRVFVLPTDPIAPVDSLASAAARQNRGSARPWTNQSHPGATSRRPPRPPQNPIHVSQGFVCPDRCDIAVSPGAYRLGVAFEDRAIVWSERSVDVRGPTVLRESYRDLRSRRRRARGVGGALTVVGVVLASVALPVAIADAAGDGCARCNGPSAGRILGFGGMVGILGGIVGLTVAAVSDDEAEFEPLTIRF